MVCRNLCDRLGCKPSFEYDQYIDGKKYCRGCETYFYYKGISVHAAECSEDYLQPVRKVRGGGLGKGKRQQQHIVYNY